MQSKISVKSSFIAVGIFLLFLLSLGLHSQPSHSFSLQPKEEVEENLPAHLRIPKIGIDASVEHVGSTPPGAIGVPAGPENVAWFSLSPVPGEAGSSIIDGHSGWKNNAPAAFDDLYRLRKGDEIYVEDKAGVTTTFIVRELQSYDKDERPEEVFSSKDGKAHLNLITCAGDWNALEQSHSKRLVVFTDKE